MLVRSLISDGREKRSGRVAWARLVRDCGGCSFSMLYVVEYGDWWWLAAAYFQSMVREI